jgi:hypothetical protein
MRGIIEIMERLKPPAQVAVVIGVFLLLALIALNPVASVTIISFLTALVSLFNRGGGEAKN